MHLLSICWRFPDRDACVARMEKVGWASDPPCPHCGSPKVARKADGHRVGRWNCHACKSSFNALSGTISEKTELPLQKWFMAIGPMVDAKKGLSGYPPARDLGLNQKSAWYMQHAFAPK